MSTSQPDSVSNPRAPRWHRLGRTVVIGATSVVALFALADCGGNDSSGSSAPQVAALPSSSAPAGSSAPTTTQQPTAGRPQERLDDTPAQHEALIHAWDVCLLANGATSQGAVGPVGAGQTGTREDLVAEPIPKKAIDACMSKEPLGPPEEDPGLNPNYRNDTLAEISCLRSHGVMVHLTQDTSVYPNGLAWTFDDNAPPLPANESQLETTCELTAFADKK